ncbi:MAG: DivIVA domain-containing protein [Ilumatobacteraceae bacterium]
MALSPQSIRDTTFKSAKRGYDQSEVNAFVDEVAATVEAAQNEATAMEARARAAVARLQELSQQSSESSASEPSNDVNLKVDEAETISRTLLLAQRTADTTIAEAQAEADRVLAAARDEASGNLDGARQESERLIEEAKADARRAGETERVQVEGEVQALLARRDFLEADVDHLEQYLVAQRERITEAVGALQDLVSRIPDGLADMRRPLMSAAAEPPPSSDAPGEDDPFDVTDADLAAQAEAVVGGDVAGTVDEQSEIAEITKVATSGAERTADATPTEPGRPLFDDDGEPTAQLGMVNPQDR